MYKLKKYINFFCKKSLFICGAGTNPATSSSDEDIAAFFDRVTAPTKDGYNFLYWSKTADGAAIDEEQEGKMSALLDAGSADTVTLYAVYEIIKQETITISVICGDVNGDDVADNIDATYILGSIGRNDQIGDHYPIGTVITTIAGLDIVCGDVNGDGVADNIDATYILGSIGRNDQIGNYYPIGTAIEFEVPKTEE